MAKETKLFRLEAHLQDEKAFGGMSGYRIFIGYKAIKHVHLFNCARLEHYRVDQSLVDKVAKKPVEPLDIAKAKTYLAAIDTNRNRNKTLELWDGGKWCDVFVEMLKGAEAPEQEPPDETAPEPVIDYVAPKGEAAKLQEESSAELVKKSKEAKKARADKQAEAIMKKTERQKAKAKATPAPATEKAKEKAAQPAPAKGKAKKAAPPPGKAKPAPQPAPEKAREKAGKAKAQKGSGPKAQPTAAPAKGKGKPRKGIPEGRIVFLKKGNPRQEGTGSWKRYNAMVAYVSKHPKATAAEVIANTIYRSDDLRWDIERSKAIEVKK